ncbi:MAG TPA: aminotransferase class V-fold PLP-dependent enzyme, partial [Coriobacteriia bacterium]|nr:aminotransferase class V-fold PLP-dependent enzyme [Coriobacteriia bacterium]
MENVYFDYAATTPVDERVVQAMLPFFSERFGNPNSLYALGRDSYRALEEARERFAVGIGAERPNEVLFTGAGTESDNAALIGILNRIAPDGGAHLIVSAYE